MFLILAIFSNFKPFLRDFHQYVGKIGLYIKKGCSYHSKNECATFIFI
jgi:hypothetical protein